jgi:hypothetical protein
MKKYTILFGAICAVMLAFSQNAKATEIPFTSTLNVANPDLAAFGAGPYGTVTVTLSGNTASITFAAASGFEFVDGKAAAVQINSTDFTPDPLSVSPNPAADPFTGFGSQPPGSTDGFGAFNLTVNYKDASIGFSTISFDVTNNLSTWSSAADVLTFNSKSFDAAAHMRATINNPQGLTGFAGEGPGTPTVPDGGATAALLGLGLAGLAGIRAKFGRN